MRYMCVVANVGMRARSRPAVLVSPSALSRRREEDDKTCKRDDEICIKKSLAALRQEEQVD